MWVYCIYMMYFLMSIWEKSFKTDLKIFAIATRLAGLWINHLKFYVNDEPNLIKKVIFF